MTLDGTVALVTGAARGIGSGVRAHIVAARYAAPLLIARGRGLIVLTGYAHSGDEVLAEHLYYDLAMRATSRLAESFSQDLGPYGVAAVTVSPRITRTEAIAAALDGPFPPGTDSVEFPGRAVRALAEDPHVDRHAGRTLDVAELAQLYGFTDMDDDTGA